MKKIAIFGGTFNPIHNGHLNLLRQVQQQMEFDEILLVPAHIPPHKTVKNLASGNDRMEMLRLAVENIPEAGVCDVELTEKGKSYTIDTLKKLHALFSTDQLYFIIGTDMLLTFDTWKRWKDILKLAIVVASGRDENEYQLLLKKAESLSDDRILVLKTDPLPLSSTQVRKKLSAGEGAEKLVPPAVLSYIHEKGLYR